MEDMILERVGKKYKSLVDVKYAFKNFIVKEDDIFKTAFITPDHHIKCCVIFRLTNAPDILARAISIAYSYLLNNGLANTMTI